VRQCYVVFWDAHEAVKAREGATLPIQQNHSASSPVPSRSTALICDSGDDDDFGLVYSCRRCVCFCIRLLVVGQHRVIARRRWLFLLDSVLVMSGVAEAFL
jgi:hypothetical protein